MPLRFIEFFLPREWCFMCNPCFLEQSIKERYRKAPLPCKTSYASRVAPHHCPASHMSKRKFMIPGYHLLIDLLAPFIRDGGLVFPTGWPYNSVTMDFSIRYLYLLQNTILMVSCKIFFLVLHSSPGVLEYVI